MTPPLSQAEAASLQAACIGDVLDAYADTPVRALHFDGQHGIWDGAAALGWSLHEQPQSTLGGRMQAALPGDMVTAVVGTDSPDLPRALLHAAVERVAAGVCDVALVPAEDGGFCSLVATSLPAGALDGIAWSCDDTLARTVERLDSLGLRVFLTQPWYDLDTVADLHRLWVESHTKGAAAPRRVLALLQQLGWFSGETPDCVSSFAALPPTSNREHEHD